MSPPTSYAGCMKAPSSSPHCGSVAAHRSWLALLDHQSPNQELHASALRDSLLPAAGSLLDAMNYMGRILPMIPQASSAMRVDSDQLYLAMASFTTEDTSLSMCLHHTSGPCIWVAGGHALVLLFKNALLCGLVNSTTGMCR